MEDYGYATIPDAVKNLPLRGADSSGADLSASADSVSSMTITWTTIPSSGCSGSVDYYARAISGSHRVDVFTPIGASSYVFTELGAGAYNVEVYSYCYATDEYSQSPGSASVTISATASATPVPTRDDSLGVAPPTGLSASASSNTIIVTWTSVAGQTAPAGYCDALDYQVDIADDSNSVVASSEYITGGTWTSGTLTAGTYKASVAAYSSECDDWSTFVDTYVTVS